MLRRVVWGVGCGALLLLSYAWCARPHPTPGPDYAAEAAQLRKDSAQTAVDVAALRLRVAVMNDSLRQIKHERDSLRTRSAHVTNQIVTEYATLPPVSAIPDSSLRVELARTRTLLDSAVMQLQVKDYMLGLDDTAWALEEARDSTERSQAEKRYQLMALSVSAAQKDAKGWQVKYDSQHPWCGRRCGMVIGSGGTLALIWVAAQVLGAH